MVLEYKEYKDLQNDLHPNNSNYKNLNLLTFFGFNWTPACESNDPTTSTILEILPAALLPLINVNNVTQFWFNQSTNWRKLDRLEYREMNNYK